MTDSDLKLVACQLGDCRNAAALTVTIELPTSWTESREYTTRTLLVAVCGECAPVLEADARALLEARAQCGRRMQTAADYADLMRMLLALIDAVGAPYEPDQGSTFATWLDKLDKPRAQSAWRLLAFVKRQTLAGKTVRDGWWRKARRAPDAKAASHRTTSRPLSIEDARFRRRALEQPPDQPPTDAPTPTIPLPPRGGDDAA